MQRKDGVHWAAVAFITTLLLFIMMPNAVSIISEPEEVSHITAALHEPFVIVGDVNFSDTASAEGWSGDGSSGSPYIIENLEITLGPSPTAAINITDTRVYFIIRGCQITGPLATPSYGVYLENVTNGRINDIHCNGFSHGIYIEESNSITASNNNCSDNSYGIWVQSSNSITVINNVCSNTYFLGIRLDSSNSSIVSGNTCNDGDINGIYLYNCNSTTANDNVCNNNNYGLFLHTCNFSTVNRNTCNENALSGIYLYKSHSSSAANNTCNSNREGMYIQEMESNSVTGNTCFNNSLRGIALQVCDLTNLTFNTIANTTIQFGLYIDGLSDNNDVTWNVLVHNVFNCIDDGIGNVFNSNYWSDYGGVDNNGDGIGDTAYVFATTNSDPNPLMYYPFPPEFEQAPVDQISELGTYWSYALDFIVAATTAPYYLSVNDSVNFVAGSDDSIGSMFFLPVGAYPIEVTATNIYGFITKCTFTLSIIDTTPPIITHPDDMSYIKGESPPEIRWNAQDLSLIGYVVLLDGSELTSSNGAVSTSVSFGMILEDKEPGTYNYTMVVEDVWGNMAFDTVIVTVHPVPLLETLLPWLVVGAAAVVIVIVSFVIFRRRKSS